MTPNLATRLQDIPGVASVVVDLDDEQDARINVRIEEGSDEADVLERVRALLVAYGVRSERSPALRIGRRPTRRAVEPLGVDVKITPIAAGARVEVLGRSVKSFRVVAATPSAIAQGLADAWSQVAARVPVEIVGVTLDDDGGITVVADHDGVHTTGSADVSDGWTQGLALAVGRAIGVLGLPDSPMESKLANASW